MKKQLLLLLGIFLTNLIFAQNHGNMNQDNKETKSGDPVKSIDESLVFMGLATNVFTILKTMQNQVDYNPDLNAITFVHRQDISLTPEGGSGTIRFDYSVDAGVNWNINQGPLSVDLVAADGELTVPTVIGEEDVFGLRFPNGAIFNPEGNTDLANAFYVTASAAAVRDEGFIGHIGVNCFTATNLGDLSTPSEQYLQAVSPDDYSGDYHPFGLVQGGDAMYAASTLFFEDQNFDNYSKIAIWKGVLNDEQTDFDWSATVIEPDFSDFLADEGQGQYQSLMTRDSRSIAFSPDGSVGYMVVLGSLNEYEEKLSRPIAYKTTDGGETWVLQPELDIANMSVANLVEYTEGSNTIKRPVVWSMDIVVDATGALHVFSEMNRGNPTDGQAFTWYDYDTEISNTFYVDFKLNPNGSWSSQYIGEAINTDVGVLDGFWASIYVVEHGLQASRTSDGNKVFFSWLASPSSNDDTNNEPDIFARGLDVENSTITDIKNLTENSDIESFVDVASLSPVCISNGEDFNYELPFVSIEFFVLGSVEETNFVFLKGMGFDESEFLPLAVDELSKKDIALSMWPNPAIKNLSISYHLKSSAAVSVSIFNALGKKVSSSSLSNKNAGLHQNTMDISTLKSGIYFVKLLVGNQTYTEKIVVQD